MSTLSKTSLGTLEKRVKQLSIAAERSAVDAVKIALNQATTFYMTFDEVDAVPMHTDASGRLVISSIGTDDALSALFELQTEIALTTLGSVLQHGIKEALK